ncbi:MAG: hypothetical protein ACRC80_27400 [Waterburya sp.]
MSKSKLLFAVCINNENYLASLEKRKIYQIISDQGAAEQNLIRVIDESGEDYLYPNNYFALIELPSLAEEAFAIVQ